MKESFLTLLDFDMDTNYKNWASIEDGNKEYKTVERARRIFNDYKWLYDLSNIDPLIKSCLVIFCRSELTMDDLFQLIIECQLLNQKQFKEALTDKLYNG